MKKVLYILMAFALLLGVSSCNEWLNVNTDPTNPSSEVASEEVRLPWIQYYYSYAWGTANTRGGAIAQVVMGTSRTATVGEQALWNPDTGVSTTVYQNWFLGAACNIPELLERAEENGAYHYMGAALVVKAMGFVMMADLYGEMPYTEGVQRDILSPKYDNGDVIYAGCLADLDKAIEYFGMQQSETATPLSAGDIWCGGDVNKWIQLCYGLKARWLNNLSKVTVEKSGLKYDPAAILAALEKAPKTLGESIIMKHYNVDQASTNFTVGDAYGPNVTWDSAAWGTGQRFNRWFVKLLTDFQGSGVMDPRAKKILPSAMYKAKIDVTNKKIVSYEWILDEGVNLYTAEDGWKNNRMEEGNLNAYLTLAVKDVAKEYIIEDIEKYYKTVDDFKAAIAKYYSAENVTVSDDTVKVKKDGKEVIKETVKVVYHPGAMYVNDTNPVFVEDIKYVQLRSDAVYETQGLAANDMNCYYSAVSADTRAYGFVQGTGSFYARPDSDSDLLSYVEMLFIKAEVLFRQGKTAEAYNAYKEAVQAHFDRMNVQLKTWKGKNCNLTKLGYDVSFAYNEMSEDDIKAYMASAAVAQSAAELTMSDIMMQKVIAMGISYQTWNDVRRYNYGAGTVGNFGVVYEGMTTPKYRLMGSSTFDPDPKNSRHYPRRWLQCSHETGYNSKNCNAAVEQYSQYGIDNALDFDLWSIPVWWDWD